MAAPLVQAIALLIKLFHPTYNNSIVHQPCEISKYNSKASSLGLLSKTCCSQSSSRWHPGRCLSSRPLHPDTNSPGHWLAAVSQDWQATSHAWEGGAPKSFISCCLDTDACQKQATYWSPFHCGSLGTEVVFSLESLLFQPFWLLPLRDKKTQVWQHLRGIYEMSFLYLNNDKGSGVSWKMQVSRLWLQLYWLL